MNLYSILLATASFMMPLGAVSSPPPPARYLKLSDEALASARYRKAFDYSKNYLENNINSPGCTSEMLSHHLRNMRLAAEAIGLTDEYKNFCQVLFSKIDPTSKGTLVRAFFLISTDCKGDYNINKSKAHTFSLTGDNSDGLAFFDANLERLPSDLLENKPLLKVWLPIVKADLLAYGEDFDGAAEEIKKASQLADALPTDSPDRLIIGLARELLAARRANWKEAAAIGQENLRAIEAKGANSKEYYAQNARLLFYYNQLDEHAKAIEAGEKAAVRPSVFEVAPALINLRSIQGPGVENSPSNLIADRDYDLINILLAKSFFALGQNEKGAKSADRVLYGLQKEIAGKYADFAFNRADAPLKAKVDLLVQNAPSLSILAPADSMLQSLAFDAALIYKQLSLSAGSLYRNAIARLNNQALSARYHELEQCRMAMDLATDTQADSLIERIAVLESNLSRNLSSRLKISPAAMPKWTDVRSSLAPDEAAIEFSVAYTPSGDRYIASIVKKDSNYPEVFDLCGVEQINDMKNHCGSTAAYETLWKPMEAVLAGINTIYFSPAGNLNLLPIEYFPINDKQSFNDRYTTFRLSTTRELAERSETKKPESILLYGGVKYNLDENEKAATDKAADQATERFFAEEFDVNEASTPGLRAGIAYLPATLDEINEIADIFASANLTTSRYEGAQATETTIKELDSKSIPVVHIATHGFTVPKKSRSRLGRVLSRNDDRSTFEEQSLGRSGLMMAGAANTIDSKDKNSVNRFDDGILTGREISRLDLSGINTVVLSACESGLGEVGSEGVAGLQRGLKRAGVKTLVMSLWKVSDEATAILMTDFYRNLLSGQNSAEAMRNAQNHLKTMDGGKFSDPTFWAPFIILDAI